MHAAGGGCTGHWLGLQLGLADTGGALNMVPGRQGKKVIVAGGEFGPWALPNEQGQQWDNGQQWDSNWQGQQPQLNPHTWAIQVQYWSYTYTCTLTYKQVSI